MEGRNLKILIVAIGVVLLLVFVATLVLAGDIRNLVDAVQGGAKEVPYRP